MRTFLAVSTVAFVIVACGGKFTSVDSNKPTNQLQPSDSNQLCQDEYNFIVDSFSKDDVVKFMCSSSFDQGGDCHTTFDTCISQGNANVVWPPSQGPDCNAFAQALAQCNTTVGQYQTCVQQEVNLLKSVESKLPFCSQGDEQSAYLQAAGQVSADCLNLLEKCPIQFSSSSASALDGGAPDGG